MTKDVPLIRSLVLVIVVFLVSRIAIADNPVVIKNRNAGSTQWQIVTSSSEVIGQIKGYASATSTNKGDSITFYVSVNPAQTFTIDVYAWVGMGEPAAG